MSTLTGNKISLTYKSIFKTSDNDVLTAALKQMSDGFGNNSGIYLNTGGDLKSTGILEFANFKGTSSAVSINRLVSEADGISNNDNDISLPTSAAVKDYVDTHVTTQDLDFKGDSGTGAVDLDSQLLDIAGTTNEITTVALNQKLTIGLPNNVIISGTYTGATFLGDLNGTINTATTATTQSSGTSNTTVATTKFVMDLDSASDLDFSGTTGTGDVNLNTQSFAVTGTANQITTVASNQGLQISLLSTGVTMPNGSIATTQSAGDNSTKVATTAYVDVLDSASDLDFSGTTGTGAVNLNTQNFSILGTTNEIETSALNQRIQIGLPSTINVNVVGNVTGALTGNADTATKWETARNLSVSGEATGTISNVDGSVAVSGAVTLTNSAVVGKVLTGLPTPAAGNIQAADTILEAFGKVQSQINSISSGLIFKGSWDAATNTPTLISGGGEVDSGTTDGATTAFKLIDSSQNFNTSVSIGNKVINQVDGTTALVTVIDSNTQLTLNTDIMLTAEAYTIDASPFIPQGNYYVVNFAGTTPLNGINVWSIGDWVIADADNRWSKLDHSQVDGQGTPNTLPKWETATTLIDSIVAESGTALTITGSATTTLGLSSTGNFAVNTNKFTANATTGNVAFTGDLAINTNKFTVSGTSGNIAVAGTGTFAGNVAINSFLKINGVSAGTSTFQEWRNDGGLFAYNGSAAAIISGGSATDYVAGNTTGATSVILATNNSARLTISGTGAATFAGNLGIGTAPITSPNGADKSLSIFSGQDCGIILKDNVETWEIYQNDDLQFSFGTTPTTVLTLARTTGNATFTGTVTSKGNIFNTLDSVFSTDGSISKNATVGLVMRGVAGSVFDLALYGAGGTALMTNATGTNNIVFNSGNVTVAGNITGLTSSFVSTVAGTTVVSSEGAYAGSGSVKLFEAKRNGGAVKSDWSYNESVSPLQMEIGTSTSHSFAIKTADTPRLTIDNSGNSTFAGSVTSNAGLITSTLAGDSFLISKSTSATGRGFIKNIGNTGAVLVSAVYGSSASGSLFGNSITGAASIVTTSDSAVHPTSLLIGTFTEIPLILGTGNVERLKIDGSGNATFAGIVGMGSTGIYAGTGAQLNLPGKGLSIKNDLNGSNNNWSFIENTAPSSEANLNFHTGNNTAALTLSHTGNARFALEMNANVVIARDNMFVGLGQFYIGAETSNVDNTFRQVVSTSAGTFKLQKRISGTFTDVLAFDNSQNANFAGDVKVADRLLINAAATGSPYLSFDQDGTEKAYIQYIDSGSGTDNLTIQSDGVLTFRTGPNTERMRITTAGNALFGIIDEASQPTNKNFFTVDNQSGPSITVGGHGGTHTAVLFRHNGGTTPGSIVITTNTVTYGSASDYRLKEDLQDFAGLDMVSKIPVYNFKWKSDKGRSYGVMAHELQEVLPNAVTGQKDAEEMQGVDYSKIVPLLVKSIQELSAKVERLEKECKCK